VLRNLSVLASLEQKYFPSTSNNGERAEDLHGSIRPTSSFPSTSSRPTHLSSGILMWCLSPNFFLIPQVCFSFYLPPIFPSLIPSVASPFYSPISQIPDPAGLFICLRYDSLL
jgi:hypothetical protein